MMRPTALLLAGIFLLTALISVAAEPGGPSYMEIADKAYQDKDWAKAAEYYQKWVDADPSDANSWYNYACTLALNGQPKDAAKTLLDAVEAGWRNKTHTEQDPDLDTIRDQPDYQKALERIDELVAKESKEGNKIRFFTRQTKMGEYWVRLPSDYDSLKSYPLVILLHGRGGDGERFINLGGTLDTVSFIYAAPRAPYYINDTQNGFQYFPAVSRSDTAVFATGAELMTDWVVQVAKDVSDHYKIAGTKFWVVGFSQGGAAAYLMGLLKPYAVSGVVALGGFLIDELATADRFEQMEKAGVKVFIGQGSEDQSVTPDEAVKARDKLLEYKMDVTYKTYPAGHAIPEDMRHDVAAWLQTQIQQ
jgi:phospholipase/carboxylesterase